MRFIVSRSLRFRWLVVFAAVVLLAVGIAEVPRTKVDVFPEFAPPRVEIQTIALGNSSNEVEELITVPIEEQLSGIEGLEAMRSKSVAQLSSIQLIFSGGTDELRARQLVAERVSQVTATLPTWASPPFMMPALSSTSRIMKIGMSSDTVDLIDMSTIAYWKVRARLLRVPGVAQVAIWGERLPQRHVQVDPQKLAQHDVTLQQVMDAGADALDAGLLKYSDGAVVGTGGFVETAGQRYDVRLVQPIVGPEQLGTVPVLERDGKVVRLADLGQVVVDSGPIWGDAVINGGPGLMLVVQKYRGANTLEVTRGVDDALAAMAPGLQGISVDPTIFRPATFIEQSIDNLTRALLLGVLLVVLVLALFLYEWRTALISLVAIPLSLVGALLVLDASGATVNVMVLAGLVVAIGVVVDDAIIDVENIVRTAQAGPGRGLGPVDLTHRPGGLARGPYGDHVRDRHQRRRGGAGAVPAGAVRVVLPAAGAVVRPRRAGLDGGRPDRHPRAVPGHARPAGAADPGTGAAAGAQARLPGGPRPGAAPPLPRRRRGAGGHPRRRARRADPGQPAAAQLQGA